MENRNQNSFGFGNDKALINFLQSEKKEKYTRFDAYCDLINRLSKDPLETGKSSDSISKVCFGCSKASISELAEKWNWHRSCVREFLHGLEELGYIYREMNGKTYTFSLKADLNILLPITDAADLYDIMMFLLRHSDDYMLEDDIVASYFDIYFQMVADDFMDESGKVNMVELAESKAAVVLECFENLNFSSSRSLHEDEVVFPLIKQTFLQENPWSWTKWITLLNLFDFALLANEWNEDQLFDAETEEQYCNCMGFSEEDLDLMKKITAYVWKINHSDDDR